MNNLNQGMLSIYLAQILNKKVAVTGSLDRFRDFVYIDDAIRALKINFMNKDQNIYNIGSGKPTKVIDLIKMIFKILKIKPKIIELSGHKGDTFGSYANITGIKKLDGTQSEIIQWNY